ncbi:Polyol:NADP oxidoreductase [Vibrio aerogenes CECT 7868]|uniref:Polyol:NADP oxidoreductase n=1 Tax=Vibrio aerogenes CECT 7868 TaxID=1216006 RepID=A0A1M6CGU2_9VIBR|nr:fructuronate reductase [Vibrio aerogenes]SHI59908.1 Polyol:NADP oxidoreductase [Vibrio aerogenes CECT 7868]
MKNISNTQLPLSAKVPDYDRQKLKTKIVHLGFGAFHRAHQALYTDELAKKSDSDWGICGINLFSGGPLIQSLREQDYLYTVVEKGAQATEIKVVGSVIQALHPGLDGMNTIIEKMAEPQVAIVSMTITEKGYCIDPATGTLDTGNPLVIADLATPEQPQSALGYIVQALKKRRERGLAPFTVMPCDNIQENGHVAKTAILAFARQLDETLAQWIEAHVTFPCTMVDRIVPAATPETLNEISQLLGVDDPCSIACEPFSQWVIEDNFVAGRPDWDLAGATFVTDVVPYEEMKLRMLNGSHSFLAYLGYLGGFEHIADTMTDEGYRKAALDMMLKAQAPSLNMPAGTNLESYAALLIERYSNPALKHKTWQIAMDGSQKIPQRLGGSLRYHLSQGTDFTWIATGIAGWMRYVAGVDEQNNPIEVKDPMADALRAICDQHGFNTSVVPALLGVEAIFTPDIGQNSQVIEAVSAAYQSLIEKGAKETVRALSAK